MKRKPFEVTAALKAVGLQVQRRNAIAFVTRRPSNGRINTSRATQPRSSESAYLKGPSNMFPVTTVHLQANPFHLVREVITSVRDSALRNFLERVLEDDMVDSALSTAVGAGNMGALYPIQFIQKAAHLCSHAQVRSPQHKDLVFVATVIRGLSNSLDKGICCKPDHEGCLRHVLSAALDELRDASYAMGFALEQLLQWSYDFGCDEQLDDARMQMDHFLAKSYAQWGAQA
jgi:hypothetical protein